MMSLEDKKIVIATHVYTTGPAQDLREYLIKKKVLNLVFIGHPLFFDKKLKSSGYEIYQKGGLVKENYGKIKKIPTVASYFKDFFLNIIWAFEKSDLYIGSDNLNAFSGILLKRLGRTKKVIYYVIDYNPGRFENKILNKLYHRIDRFCVKYADETWNLSPRMEGARKKYFNFEGGNQKVVPIGIWTDRIKIPDFSEVEKNTLVFMGHILEKQGVQYILEAIPLIAKEISDFKLLVVGGGNYLEKLKEKAKDLNIEKYVNFSGFVENHEEIERILAKCTAAAALYEKFDKKGDLSFSYFADSGKIKSYLANGLPVLLTDVPYNAKEIQENECGFIVDYEKENIARAVIDLMKNESKLKEYRQNAVNYSKKYDWNLIFSKNL